MTPLFSYPKQSLPFKQEAFMVLTNYAINYNAAQRHQSGSQQSFVHCGLQYYGAQ